MRTSFASSFRQINDNIAKPRILYVITRAEHGGAQMHVLKLALSLRSEFEVEVATGEEGFLTKACRQSGIPVHVISSLQREIRPLKDARACWALYRLVRRVCPDLIHGHTFKAGFLGRIVARTLNIPSVYTLHSWLFGTAATPTRWSIFAGPCEWLGALCCQRVVTISNEGEGLLRKYLKGAASKIVTIRNGIPDCGERKCANDNDGVVRVIMVARFTKVKEFDILLRAFAATPASTTLQLVGDGPTRSGCETLVRELGLVHRVQFLGSRDDVPSLLAKSDIFVLASKYEMSPISILEAMRAGLPTIASNVGGVKEVLGDAGILVPAGSVDCLSKALTDLVGNTDLRIRMGQAARLRFEQHYDFRRQLALTSSLYKEVLLGASRCLAEPVGVNVPGYFGRSGSVILGRKPQMSILQPQEQARKFRGPVC